MNNLKLEKKKYLNNMRLKQFILNNGTKNVQESTKCISTLSLQRACHSNSEMIGHTYPDVKHQVFCRDIWPKKNTAENKKFKNKKKHTFISLLYDCTNLYLMEFNDYTQICKLYFYKYFMSFKYQVIISQKEIFTPVTYKLLIVSNLVLKLLISIINPM